MGRVADGLWYPLWDANVQLDHSVRTVPEALQVAAADIPAALGMLDARHIVGDEELSRLLIGGALRQWRSRNSRPRSTNSSRDAPGRWQRSGEIAHRAEPDLKNGRGGLRDVQLLDALAMAQLTDAVPGLASRRARWRARGRPPGACSTCAPSCTGCPAAAATNCGHRTPTRSAPRCASATASTWRARSATPHAPSATTSTSGCAPPATRCRARACPRLRRSRCADRSTRASSNTPAR